MAEPLVSLATALRRISPLRWAVLAAIVAGAGCSFPEGPASVESLLVSTPQPPESWAVLPRLSYRLTWCRPDGSAASVVLEPGASTVITVARGRVQWLFAEPFFAGRSLRPAGALYPFGRAPDAAGGPTLVLGWREGWLAAVARALEEGGADPRAYDLARLMRELAAEGGDPWAALPPRRAAGALVAGTFRTTLLRAAPAVPLCLPGPGPWVPESALASAPLLRADGAYAASLSPGEHRFFGTDSRLLVRVEEGGGAYVLEAGP